MELFQEAADSGAILFIDHFHALFGLSPTFEAFLKKTLSQSEFALIAGIDASSRAQFLQQDREWKRLFRTILIHDIEMPFQL